MAELTPEAATAILGWLRSGGRPGVPTAQRAIEDFVVQPFRDAYRHGRDLLYPPASPPMPQEMIDGTAYPGRIPSAPTALDSGLGLGLAIAGIVGPPGAKAGRLAGKAAEATVPKFGNLAGRGALPMDDAARMARAEDLGYMTNFPLYHGAAPVKEFRAFDPATRGSTTGAASAQLSLSATPDAELANRYAEVAAKQTGGNPVVYPLVHRAEQKGRIRLSGDETDREVAATLADAWDRGYDSILMENVHDINMPGKPTTVLFVKNANQLRSPNAAFDPAKRDGSDLLAGIAGGAVAAPVIWGSLSGGQRQ